MGWKAVLISVKSASADQAGEVASSNDVLAKQINSRDCGFMEFSLIDTERKIVAASQAYWPQNLHARNRIIISQWRERNLLFRYDPLVG